MYKQNILVEAVLNRISPQMLAIFYLFFTFHFSLLAKESLPILVEGGEPFSNRAAYYIPDRSPVSAVVISPDGKTIVSGSSDGSIKILDSDTGRVLKCMVGHKGDIFSLAISPDEKTIISGSTDGIIKIWDIATGRELEHLKGHQGNIYAMAISPDGKTIVSDSKENIIKIIDIATGKELKSLKRDTGNVYSISISTDGKKIVMGLGDGSIIIWDSSTGEELMRLEGHKSFVYPLAMSPDGKSIVSGSRDGSIKIRDSSTGKELKHLKGNKGDVFSLAISPDGKRIISGSMYGSIKIWDLATGKALKHFQSHKGDVFSLDISSDGKTIVVGLMDGSIKIWDSSTGKELKRLEGDQNTVYSLALSPDGKTIALALRDGSINVCDIATGKELKHLEGHQNTVRSLVMSPDGTKLFSGSADRSIKIWDLAKGKELKSLKGHESTVRSLVISPDGTKLFSGASDKSIKTWDIAKGKELEHLEGGKTKVSALAISPDGKTIVTNSTEDSIKIWDSITGEELNSLEGQQSRVRSLAISPDGKTIVTVSSEGSVKQWGMQSGKLLKEFISGQNGTWVTFDYQTKRLMRGDDGTLLYRKDGITLALLSPPWLSKEERVSLSSSGVSVLNNSHNRLKIDVQNISNERLYWIKNQNYFDEYCHLMEHRVSTLESNETKSLLIDIGVTLAKINPKPIAKHEINLKLFTSAGAEFNLTVPISIRYANMIVKKAEVSEDEMTLNVTLQNIGNAPLVKAAVQLSKPFKTDRQEISNLEANQSKSLLFILSQKLDNEATIALKIVTINDEKHKELPIYEWQIEITNVTIFLNRMSWYLYLFMALGILILSWFIWYFNRYKNATVETFRNDPQSLLHTSPTLFLQAQVELEKLEEWEETLTSAYISEPRAKKVSIFYNNPQQNMELFKELLGAEHCQKEGDFYRLTLAKDFKLKVDNILVIFASDNAYNTIKKVQAQNEIVWVLVTGESEIRLVQWAKGKSNNMVATTEENLTRLLLGRESQAILAEIFTKNLSFKLLSPYPTDSGVDKEHSFFGRTEIIREVLSQNNSNYLIVGARQLGKTAILQALERRYKHDEKAECFYVTFQSESNVIASLASVLNMTKPEEVSLDALVQEISTREKKSVFLLDETDKIVQEDMKEENDYKITSTFRKLAQEGHASFVLTGFSTLYFSVTLDQASPLLNFGKLIVLDGLEKEACRELMIKPMKTMGLSYENGSVVDSLIVRCGRRANLLAITCSEIIKGLDDDEHIISQSMVDTAVNEIGLDRYKLSTWGRISANLTFNVLDRLIVYLTIDRENFGFDEIVNELEAIKPEIKIENINQSLQRLVLGYVLVLRNNKYRQRIPLLKEKLHGIETHKKGEIKELLKSEV